MSDDKARAEQLRAQCDALVQFALGCPRGGGETWDGRLEALGAARLSDEERASHLAEGAPLGKGPLPLEFRWALEALAKPHEPHFDNTGLAPAIVQQALRDYLAAAKPKVTTSSIFANAVATTRTYGSTAAGSETLRCLTCGAPRMHEQSDLTCGYCGSRDYSRA